MRERGRELDETLRGSTRCNWSAAQKYRKERQGGPSGNRPEAQAPQMKNVALALHVDHAQPTVHVLYMYTAHVLYMYTVHVHMESRFNIYSLRVDLCDLFRDIFNYLEISLII